MEFYNRNYSERDVKRIILFIIFLLIVTSGRASSSKIPDEIDKVVIKAMDQGMIPGLSLALIDGTSVTYKNYGVSQKGGNVRITSETLFEIGSCTKSFTALAVMKLTMEKKIDLDQYVSTYIPWLRFKFNGNPYEVTLRQFLQHTSGLGKETLALIPASTDEKALEQLVRKFENYELKFQPGERFEYASINYDILGFLVQCISGENFGDYLKNQIFYPLQMTSTQFGIPGTFNMAKGHKPGFFKAKEFLAPEYRGNWPSGYVISNTEDMVKFLGATIGTGWTGIDSLITFTGDFSYTNTFEDRYAYGWKVHAKKDFFFIPG